MRKYFIAIIGVCIALSCQVQKHNNTPFISIYKSNPSGLVASSYLMLKDNPQAFEIYAPGVWTTVFGRWERMNDTLYLTPQYIEGGKMQPISDCDSSILTIPQKYLIQKNTLIDKTDYSVILSDYMFLPSETEYVKLNYKK